ncbi:hypothetical protein QPK87_09600, partial [Kamptonema cortianum]|nr:hypothetical protein [Kamptonema cortianum]
MKDFLAQNGWVLAVFAVLAVLCPQLERWSDPYQQQILMMVGINCLLAVSLTLINGITGQFSIGHAAFMAIGAYGSGWVSLQIADRFFAAVSWMPAVIASNLWIVCALAVGGLLAGMAGFWWGCP